MAIRNPQLILPGDLTLFPRPTDRRTYQALTRLSEDMGSLGSFFGASGAVSGDVLVYDGANWLPQSYVPGPFGIGAASPSSQLLSLSPSSAQTGLVVDLAAGAGTDQPGLLVRDSAAQALLTVSASGGLGIGERSTRGRLQVHDQNLRLIFSGEQTLYNGVGGLILERTDINQRMGLTLANSGVAQWTISLQPLTQTIGFWSEQHGFYTIASAQDGTTEMIIRDASLTTIRDPLTVRHQTGPAIFPFPIPQAGHGTGISLWGIGNDGLEAEYTILRTVITDATSGNECNDFYFLNRDQGVMREAFRHVGATSKTFFWGAVTVAGTTFLSGDVRVSGSANLNILQANSLVVTGTTNLGPLVATNLLVNSLVVTGATNTGPLVATTLRANTLTVTGTTMLSGQVTTAGGLETWGTNVFTGPTNASGVVNLTLVDGSNSSALYPLVIEHRLAPGVSGSTQSVGIDWYSVDASGLRARFAFTKAFLNSGSPFGTALSFNTFTGGAATENLRLRNAQAWFPHDLQVDGNSGFNGTTPISKPTVSGSRGGVAALASLITALASYGLVTDSST
jgi:hypothetical protein